MKIVIKCSKCGQVIYEGSVMRVSNYFFYCPYCRSTLTKVKSIVFKSIDGEELCRIDL